MENKQPVGINMNMCDDKEIVIPSVNREFINYLKDHPYEKQNIQTGNEKFEIQEIFEKKGDCVEGTICCAKQCWKGSVEVFINIKEFPKERKTGFRCLTAPAQILGQGIGKILMLCVIQVIKDFKEYYSINDTVELKGWLSFADKEIGNWNNSVPFYENVGKKAETECYFTIKNDEQHYSAEEFLEKANEDGYINYLV